MTYRPPARKPFEYGDLITGAFRLVWRHKYMWFFGLFAGTGTSLGSWNFNYSTPDSGSGFASEIGDWVEAHLALVISLVAAAVVLGIILWLWSILCQGAVIRSVRDIRLGDSGGFGRAFRNGRHSFGRLLLFNLFLILIFAGIAIIAGAVITALIFLAASGEAGEVLTGVIATVLTLMLLGILFSSFGYLLVCTVWIVGPLLFTLFMTFAIRAVVLEGLRPVAALRRGLQVLVNNLSRSLLLFLLSVGLTIGAGIVVALVTLVAAIPSGVAWIVAYNVDFSILWIVIASVLALPTLVVLVAVAALSNTYFATYWTDAYLYFTGVVDSFKGQGSNEPHSPPAAYPAPR